MGWSTAGVDWTFARRLPGLLQQRGLSDVGAESEVALFPGGSAVADLLRLTVAQARAAGLTGSATDQQIDRWTTVVGDPRQGFHGFALVSTWGRRPGR